MYLKSDFVPKIRCDERILANNKTITHQIYHQHLQNLHAVCPCQGGKEVMLLNKHYQFK